ncbi:hypothetical protein C8N47_11128 [Mangrovibacterium marinum]|uniref:Uncharacterized protein n=1 Tax=Mangrovibacterium marinum TaxID=1639118 RepID=A0A2T5C0B2_9BACT|nr:hypothetical protein C8N47_11128 [Mangrovibacterium marinum]
MADSCLFIAQGLKFNKLPMPNVGCCCFVPNVFRLVTFFNSAWQLLTHAQAIFVTYKRASNK